MSGPTPQRDPASGVALVLVLIFTILLYVLVAELVVTARMARLTGENDALMARMQNHMVYTLAKIEEQLRDDLAAASGQEGQPGQPPGGPEGQQEQDDASNADSSQDSWYEPAGHAEGEITTYVWVEDESRKFNLLTMVSPDESFALESRQRFARLIDYLREDTEFDLSTVDGDELAGHIVEWLKSGSRTEELPRPPLKSDVAASGFDETTIPMHLDELLLLPGVTPDLFYDKVLDNRPIPGLESVLTIHTALRVDPGDPSKREADESGDPNNPAQPSAPAIPPTGSDPEDPNQYEPPIGEGIRVNINTASRAVLRCLFPEHEIPNTVIEAILRYRNEDQEEDQEQLGFEDEDPASDYYGDMALGEQVKKKIFASQDALEEIPEFRNLSNPEVKARFLSLTTVKSDVFSVHMASLFKRDEKRRNFVLRRSKSILVRLDEGEEAVLYPIMLLEERAGMRVAPIDFPDEINEFDFEAQLDELDQFAREERRWNPFFIEFYMPPVN